MKEQKTDITTEQITDVVKKKQGHRDIGSFVNPETEPGDNTRFLRFALVAWDLPPIDISDPEQVRNRIGEYFHHCMENDRKPQIVGMCNWLGITRQTLNEWRNGDARNVTHTDIIKKACSVIEEQWADYMQNGKINPAAGIFIAKNWYGYKDVADVVVTPNNPYQGESDDDLKKKYLAETGTDDDDGV